MLLLYTIGRPLKAYRKTTSSLLVSGRLNLAPGFLKVVTSMDKLSRRDCFSCDGTAEPTPYRRIDITWDNTIES
jgi:hypothetical protein